MTDPRLCLVRDGVAAVGLQGLVAAAAFRPVTALRVAAPRAWLRGTPDRSASAVSELLFGEAFDGLLEQFDGLLEQDGFCFGQSRRDGYVGFAPKDALTETAGAPTHRVCVLAAPTFARPDIKTPEPKLLPHNSLVRIVGHEGRFAEAAGAGFLIDTHLAPLGVFDCDPAEVAGAYLGAPYLWGGRTSAGIDCSGLMQQALAACGRSCPRDSDQQRDAFASIDAADARGGDLVFWPGHVAMLVDPQTIIHANGHHMQTVREPLAEATGRIGAPVGFRRP